MHPFSFEGGDGPIEIALAVSHVRPESQKGALQRHRFEYIA
jgi:hypothetical protein